MIVVSDTSVLSCLAEIGELEVLQRLYGAVTITETIRAEACDPRAPERLRTWLSTEPPWLVIADNPFPLLDETCDLDDG